MATIVELAATSELAQAVYSSLLTLGPIDSERLRIKQNGDANMSAAQADDFARRYTVERIFNDPDTGAYAAIFKNKQTQELTVAIRGTDISLNMDWVSNAYLATGIPPSLNPQFLALRPVIAQWIQSGALPLGSTLAGHSLGGYLAVYALLQKISIGLTAVTFDGLLAATSNKEFASLVGNRSQRDDGAVEDQTFHVEVRV